MGRKSRDYRPSARGYQIDVAPKRCGTGGDLIGNVMKQQKWMYHKAFKNKPAHLFDDNDQDVWAKAQCGYFAYPDMLVEARMMDNKVRCLKCLRRGYEDQD